MSLEELLHLDESIVVSSNTGENIFKTPSATTIIDEQQIIDYNFKTITEAISTLSGISIGRTYLKRNIPNFRGILQDHYSNKVLILIDGVPFWNAVTGEGFLDRIDICNVSRIEVLKGPASVMYGTNAYVGAINIVLKRREHNEGNINSELATTNKIKLGGYLNYVKDDISIFIGGSSSNEDGIETHFTDEQGETGIIKEYIEVSEFDAKIKLGNHNFNVNAFKAEESYLGVSQTFSSGANNPHYSEGILFDYFYSKKLRKGTNIKIGNVFDYSNRNISRSNDNKTRSNIEGFRNNTFIKSITELGKYINYEIGGDIESRHSYEYKNYNIQTGEMVSSVWIDADTILNGSNGMDDISIVEASLYSQLNASYKKLSGLIGVRVIENNNFGANWSSRASLIFSINDKNSIKLIYGESYRSPSIFESNFYNTTVMGNKNLEPETSNSLDLVYATSFNKFFVQVLGFYGKYENTISREIRNIQVNDTAFNINQYVNSDTFTSHGIEIELKYANPKYLSGFLNFAYVNSNDGYDESSHYNFKYVPKFSVKGGLSKKIWKIDISGLVNYSSKCEGPFAEIPSWITFDANIGYNGSLGKYHVRHVLSCKNITDTDVRIPEYVRKTTLNDVPLGNRRYLSYSLSVIF